MISSASFYGIQSGPVHPVRLRRSVLSVPAINARALEKVAGLNCDAVILDLEDSVSPDRKAEARENLIGFFARGDDGRRERIIRVNGLQSAEFDADMRMVLTCRPDAVLLPKVNGPQDVTVVADMLAQAGAPESIRIWAMMETPLSILNAAAIAECGGTAGARLDCLVVGLNDLRKDTGVLPERSRTYLVPWLMQVVLAARAHGLDVIDSVSNDFRELGAFAEECRQGRMMGFDGKMLIHPAQIEGSNAAFGFSEEEIAEAQAIIAAFSSPEAAGLNVINMDGRMIERLHLEQAERVMMKAARATQGKTSP